MNISQAVKIWLDYHRTHSKENTVRAYEWTIGKFCEKFGDADLKDPKGGFVSATSNIPFSWLSSTKDKGISN